MNNKKAWVAVAFFAVIALIVFMAVLLRSGKVEDEKTLQPQENSVNYLADENLRKIVLFFQKVGYDKLIPEYRNIMKTATVSSQAKQVLAELIDGSTEGLLPVLPPSVKINDLLVSPDGTAFVDFSREIITLSEGGTYNELMMTYGIVNSVVLNFPEISRVQILVEGKEIETLTGHIALDSPVLPDYSVIQSDGDVLFTDNLPSLIPDVE